MTVGYIFDLDGTLVDSNEQIGNSANRVRAERGYGLLSDHEILGLVGLPASALFKDLRASEQETMVLVKDFRSELRKEIMNINKEYVDALDFVTKLHSKSAHTAIATSKPTDLAKLVIENSKYNGLFEIISGTGLRDPKPDPGVILEVITSAKLKSAVMFGDRPEDMIAAKRAGIVAIGIAQTTFSTLELLDSGADKAFKNFRELILAIEDSGGDESGFFF